MVTVPYSRFVSIAALRAPQRSSILSHILAILASFSSPTGNRASMASSGAWMVSGVDTSAVKKLRRGRFLGRIEDMGARAPNSEEISPAPRKGELVVFAVHLER